MRTLAATLALLICSQLFAQNDATPSPPAAASAEAGSKSENSKDPFKLTVGYADGGINTVLKGSNTYYAESLWNPAYPFHPNKALFADVAADGNWKGKDGSHQLSVSVRPGYYIWGHHDLTDTGNYFTAYLDGRMKYGQIPGTTGDAQNVNQQIYGIGSEVAPFGSLVKRLAATCPDDPTVDDQHPFGTGKANCKLDASPYFAVRYYRVADTSTKAQDVPDGVKANKLVASFNGDVGIPRAYIRLIWELSETHQLGHAAKKWAGYTDIGLAVDWKTFGGKPVVHYLRGEKEGFKYDRQVIVGLLWDWLRNDIAAPNAKAR